MSNPATVGNVLVNLFGGCSPEPRRIKVISPPPQISKDSWLNSPEYSSFVAGYEYAATQTRAIPGLSKISPEEAYFIYEAIKHGILMSKSNLPRYTVRRVHDNNEQWGLIHYAKNEDKTLCNALIDERFTILTNDRMGIADCEICKTAFKNQKV